MTQFGSDFCVVLCHYCIWKEKIHSSLGVPSSPVTGCTGEANRVLEWSIRNRLKCSITTKSSRVWHKFLLKSSIQHCPCWHWAVDNSNQPTQKAQSHPQRDVLNWACLGVSAVTSIPLHRCGCRCSSGTRVLRALLCSEQKNPLFIIVWCFTALGMLAWRYRSALQQHVLSERCILAL